MSTDGGAGDLKSFLETVLQPGSPADVGWRNMGRAFGLLFLGACDAGADADQAMLITHGYQRAMVDRIFPPPASPPAQS